jgi:hypothetical protein
MNSLVRRIRRINEFSRDLEMNAGDFLFVFGRVVLFEDDFNIMLSCHFSGLPLLNVNFDRPVNVP